MAVALGFVVHGLLRVRCGDCGRDKLAAFSCKRRGFCPSCGARPMAQAAAHLVDHVPAACSANRRRRVLGLMGPYLTPINRTLLTWLCLQGFSLHAAVRCAAHERDSLERLCRYITRPALAKERVRCNGAGQLVLTLKTLWRDSTMHLMMSSLEFMQRVAALAPRPRLCLLELRTFFFPDAMCGQQNGQHCDG